jgi:hypothetical protein
MNNKGSIPNQNPEAQSEIETSESLIILSVKEYEFEGMLEKALASWRTPKWQWAVIAGTVLFPLAIQIRPIWNDPAAVRSVFLLGLAYLVFFLGTVVGRSLRPRPSPKHIRAFTEEIMRRGKCTNLVEVARSIAATLELTSTLEKQAIPSDSEQEPQYALVERGVMLQISRRVYALLEPPTKGGGNAAHVVVSQSGSGRINSESDRCKECSTKLEAGQLMYCKSCEAALSRRSSGA